MDIWKPQSNFNQVQRHTVKQIKMKRETNLPFETRCILLGSNRLFRFLCYYLGFF